jgi:hypothetical protein
MKILLKKLQFVIQLGSILGLLLLLIFNIILEQWTIVAKMIIFGVIGCFFWDIVPSLFWKCKKVFKYNDFD